ncbi:amino acid/amide ABC transporter substrate-binding protein, HAAT family [Rhizobiales bacterium GAS188]|nr:amino acid/amide ABC transporter substrate-binding protein, HAAT family [Rhizobiales bacterium GAS188]
MRTHRGRLHGIGLAIMLWGVTLAPARAEITVGFINAVTGPASSLGLQYKRGLAAAPMQVGSETIKLITLDDQTDTTVAVKDARKLIEDSNIDILFSPPDSPSVFAIVPVSRDAKVPLVSLSTAAVPGEDGQWMITISQPLPLMLSADVEDMKKKGVKRLAYIGFGDAWGDAVYSALKPQADAAGIEIVAKESYARADTSVTAQALRMLAAKPDAVLTGGSGSPGATPHLALAQLGYKGVAYSTHAVINADFVRVGGASVQGVIAPAGPIAVADQLPQDNPIRGACETFKAAYQRANGDVAPDPFSAYAYDGWLVFLDAAKRALAVAKPGTPEFRTALRDALASTHDVVGTHAVYSFKPGERYGVDDRARVLVQLGKSGWTLLPR